jgi:hypothetical protein
MSGTPHLRGGSHRLTPRTPAAILSGSAILRTAPTLRRTPTLVVRHLQLALFGSFTKYCQEDADVVRREWAWSCLFPSHLDPYSRSSISARILGSSIFNLFRQEVLSFPLCPFFSVSNMIRRISGATVPNSFQCPFAFWISFRSTPYFYFPFTTRKTTSSHHQARCLQLDQVLRMRELTHWLNPHRRQLRSEVSSGTRTTMSSALNPQTGLRTRPRWTQSSSSPGRTHLDFRGRIAALITLRT